jgi:hypothetical protein
VIWDLAGACCTGVLDGGGFCCASGRLDACGICDGDAGSCALRIAARVALNASAPAAAPGAPAGGAAAAPQATLGGSSSGALRVGAADRDAPDALFVNGAPPAIQLPHHAGFVSTQCSESQQHFQAAPVSLFRPS